MIDFILIDNKRESAITAEKLNINRYMFDFEKNGKAERQKLKDSRISNHSFVDLDNVSGILKKTKTVVRIDPNDDLIRQRKYFELNNVTELMIPMINDIDHFKKIIDIFSAKFKIIPLIETCFSINNLNSIIEISSCDYLHFGLNDLHLENNLNFMFSMYNENNFIKTINYLSKKNIKFGIGGIGPLSSSQILDARDVLAICVYYGGSGLILSRAFNQLLYTDKTKFESEYIKLKKYAENMTIDSNNIQQIHEKISRIEQNA